MLSVLFPNSDFHERRRQRETPTLLAKPQEGAMSGRPAPPKPWERGQAAGSAGSPSPAEGLPKPWERPPTGEVATVVPGSSAGAPAEFPLPGAAPRPWERQGTMVGGQVGTSYGGGPYGGYGAGGLGSAYGATAYGAPPYGRPLYGGAGYSGSTYGSGGMYGGGGMYGAGSMYGSSGMYGAGGGMYGSGYGAGGGMYGGGGYGGGGMYGRPMLSGYNTGMMPPPGLNPNDPSAGGYPGPPSAWQAMLASISGIVHFFGRLSFLVDENAHAVHFFIGALLQLLDRFGSLYGELARFVLRLLGFRPKDKQQQAQHAQQQAAVGTAGVPSRQPAGRALAPPTPAGSAWEGLWSPKKTI